MLSRLLLVLASAVSLVSSQSAVTVDPKSIPLATREAWCNSQTSACPLLCLQIPGAPGAPLSNNCSAQTLAYSCVCSNNASPNASQYSQTIPYYLCTEQNTQCVAGCNGDSICQANCRDDNPCGAQHPKHVNVSTAKTTTTTTTAGPTATSSHALKTPLGTATGSASRFPAIDMGYVYGIFVLVGGFMAGFVTLL